MRFKHSFGAMAVVAEQMFTCPIELGTRDSDASSTEKHGLLVTFYDASRAGGQYRVLYWSPRTGL